MIDEVEENGSVSNRLKLPILSLAMFSLHSPFYRFQSVSDINCIARNSSRIRIPRFTS